MARPPESKGEALSESSRHPLLDAAILIFVGLPSVVTALWSGLGLAVGIAEGSAFGALVRPGAVFLGAVAGIWGSETLRRRPGHRTRYALVGCLMGLVAFVAMLRVMAESMA